eukprot:scaffold990_cov393-Prasinococcus_capsulatus_cf.AAC.7
MEFVNGERLSNQLHASTYATNSNHRRSSRREADRREGTHRAAPRGARASSCSRPRQRRRRERVHIGPHAAEAGGNQLRDWPATPCFAGQRQQGGAPDV